MAGAQGSAPLVYPYGDLARMGMLQSATSHAKILKDLLPLEARFEGVRVQSMCSRYDESNAHSHLIIPSPGPDRREQDYKGE